MCERDKGPEVLWLLFCLYPGGERERETEGESKREGERERDPQAAASLRYMPQEAVR